MKIWLRTTVVLFFCAWSLFKVLPDIHWLDHSDLAMGAFELGFSHPPGQIFFSILYSFVHWLPWGSLSFRMALASFGIGLASLWLMIHMLSINLKEYKSDFKEVFVIVFLLSIMLMGPFWTQFLRLEVYPLAFFLSLLSVRPFWINQKKKKDFFMAVLALGLLFWVHPVYFACCLFLHMIFYKNISNLFVFAFVVPLLLYVYFRQPVENIWTFGLKSTGWHDVYAYLSGKMYPAYKSFQWYLFLIHLFEIVLKVFQTLWVFLSLFLVAFLKDSQKMKQYVKSNYILLMPGFLMVFFLALQSNFWPSNPDAEGYLLLVYGLLFLFLFKGFFPLFYKYMPHHKNVGVGLLVALICPIWVGQSMQKLDYSAYEHIRFLDESLIEKNELMSASFSTYSILKYGQKIEKRRPDLNILFRGIPSDRNRMEFFLKDCFLKDRNKNCELESIAWESAFEFDQNGQVQLRVLDQKISPFLSPRAWFYDLSYLKKRKKEMQRSRVFSKLKLLQLDYPHSRVYYDDAYINQLLVYSAFLGLRGFFTEQKMFKEKLSDIFKVNGYE